MTETTYTPRFACGRLATTMRALAAAKSTETRHSTFDAGRAGGRSRGDARSGRARAHGDGAGRRLLPGQPADARRTRGEGERPARGVAAYDPKSRQNLQVADLNAAARFRVPVGAIVTRLASLPHLGSLDSTGKTYARCGGAASRRSDRPFGPPSRIDGSVAARFLRSRERL